MKFLLTLINSFLLFHCLSITAASSLSASAPNAMVVSAQHLATQVGVDTLKQGGTAIDAAVAMGYALAVVHPCCGNLGGGGFMLIHLANGHNTFINFREKAPLAIKPSLFEDTKGNLRKNALSGGYLSGSLDIPYLSVGVPGTVLGLNSALKKYGTKPLQCVMQPSISLANKGFILKKGDVELLDKNTETFATQSNVAAIFLKNNKPYRVGDRLVQKDLANTLTELADHGSKAFYQGNIANKIVEASQKNGGIFTHKDLANYTIREQKPIMCNYRGYTVITTPPPGSGITVCEILNIVSGYKLSKLGFHSAKSVHYNLEAMRYAFADRNTYLGDPDFVNIPINKLISKDYAEQIRRKILPEKAGNSQALQVRFQMSEKANTTSYVVWDKYGNAVSVTYTIDDYFGAKIIPNNTGFFLNNELGDFTIKANAPNPNGLIQGTANLIAPGKRPLSSMSPTFLLKDKKLVMILGAPGGPTIATQIVQTIENFIDHNMNVQEAVDAPHYHMQWLPDTVYMEPNVFSKEILTRLSGMGYSFKLGAPFGLLNWGAVTAIVRNPKTNMLEGAIDNHWSAGSASGY